MNPTVSVIIPAYNRADKIGDAIGSVLGQTFPDFELIVVDDGSSDETGAVVCAIADPRIRYIHLPQNRGAAAARNAGIRAARGRLIALLDSDDTWTDNKLAVHVPALDAAPAGTMVSAAGIWLHALDEGRVITVSPQPRNNWLPHLAAGCDLSPGSTLIVRREAFERFGLLDENLRRLEDWDWLLRYVAAAGNILAIPDQLAHVYATGHRSSQTAEQAIRHFVAKNETIIRAQGQDFADDVIRNLWCQVAYGYGCDGDWRAMIRTLWLARYGALGKWLQSCRRTWRRVQAARRKINPPAAP